MMSSPEPIDTASSEINPYAPPTAQIKQLTAANAGGDSFYVVSPVKFWVLYIMTVNLYVIYWMYKHWANWKYVKKSDIWPVPRSIFQVFFVHSLVDEINKELRIKQIKYAWQGGLFATIVVIEMLISNAVGRFATEASPLWVQLFPFATMPLAGYCLMQIQKTANTACDDPEGRSNANFTAANIIWCVVGGLFWMMVALGFIAIVFDIE
jgi:hypothetical protein